MPHVIHKEMPRITQMLFVVLLQTCPNTLNANFDNLELTSVQRLQVTTVKLEMFTGN